MNIHALVPALRRSVLALVVLGAASAVVHQPEPERLTIYADFNRAGLNIRPGDEVRVRGLPVGHIAAIDVDRGDFSARYELSLDPSTRVAAGSTAEVVPKTVFGDKYVALDPAAPGDEVLASGALIDREATTDVAELEGVIDQAVALLEAADPAALGATLAAVAEGLSDGQDLVRASDGLTQGFEAGAARQEELRRLLAATPEVAATIAAHADDIGAAADDLSEVVALLAEEEPAMAAALRDNAELLARSQALMADVRFAHVVSSGLEVLRIVASHPGDVAQFLQAVPIYISGLASAVHGDTLYAVVPHFLLGLPRVDSSGDQADENGGSGIGPDVVIETPPYQDPYVPADVPAPEGGG